MLFITDSLYRYLWSCRAPTETGKRAIVSEWGATAEDVLPFNREPSWQSSVDQKRAKHWTGLGGMCRASLSVGTELTAGTPVVWCLRSLLSACCNDDDGTDIVIQSAKRLGIHPQQPWASVPRIWDSERNRCSGSRQGIVKIQVSGQYRWLIPDKLS